jgi:hypothetical protein
MQLEERLARLEGMAEEHSKRIDDLRWFFYVTWGVTWGLLFISLQLLRGGSLGLSFKLPRGVDA